MFIILMNENVITFFWKDINVNGFDFSVINVFAFHMNVPKRLQYLNQDGMKKKRV